MNQRVLLTRAIGILLFIVLFAACGSPRLSPSETPVPAQPTQTQLPSNPTITSTNIPESTNTTINDSTNPDMQQLHVVGNKITNLEGEVVVLRGYVINDPVNLASRRFPNDPFWSEALFQELHDWGATLVRLPIHPPNFKKDEAAALELIDQAIEWAGRNGIYVIIDYHGFSFPPSGFLTEICYETCTAATMADTIHFWQVISQRYAENNVVAFYELFNEPASHPWNGLPESKEDWLAWKAFNELLIDLIRANDSEKIILVAGLNFAKDQSYILEEPIERNNVAYAAHHNPTTNWKFSEVADRYPVVVTEVSFTLGISGSEGYSNETNYEGVQPYRQAITSLMDEKNISWTVAAFAPSWGKFSMIEGPDFEPTETGRFWKDYISGYNHEVFTGERIHSDLGIFSKAVGYWVTNNPRDGRPLSLLISHAYQGDHLFSIRYLEENVPLCGLNRSGIPQWDGKAQGIGKAFYEKLDVGPINIECQNDSGYVGGLYFNSFLYDPETDTLTDLYGSQWTRDD